MAEELKTALRSENRPAEKNRKINDIIKSLRAEDVDSIVSRLKEDTALEWEGIRLKLAKAFKRSDLVIEILQAGNLSCINQAVKLQWMYQEGSLFQSPSYLVDELFPKCSYSCRQKIITNVGTFMKKEEKVDEIFKAIETKYGFFIALPLLKGCSKLQITSVLLSRNVKLGDDQLLRIAKKYPDVVTDYLRKLYKKYAAYEIRNYNSTLKFLVDIAPEDFMKLFGEFPKFVRYMGLQLGVRRTKRILKINPQHVIENTLEYDSVLSTQQIRRQLTWEQYKTLLLSLVKPSKQHFPHQWDSDSMWKWMDTLSKPKQLEILEIVYSNTFGKQIHECPEYLTPNMVALLPEEQKLKAIEWKMERDESHHSFRLRLCRSSDIYYSGHSQGFWTAIKPIHLSVPELTQLLYIEQDVNNRGTLCKFLILTCVVNNTTEELTNILRLLNKRCRNDQQGVRSQVLDALAIASVYIKFEKSHWEGILELLLLCQLYKELGRNSGDTKIILNRSIAFHLRNKLPIDIWMGLLVAVNCSTSYCNWDIDLSLIKDPQEQKIYLESFIVGMSNACPIKEDELFPDLSMEGVALMVQKISHWNIENGEVHGKIPILAHPWLSAVLTEFFKSDVEVNWYMGSRQYTIDKMRVFNLLQHDDNFKVDALSTAVATEPFLSYYFYQDPSRLLKDIDQVVSESLKKLGTYMKFVRKLKSLNYLSFTEKFVEGCKNAIKKEEINEDVAKEMANAVKILSVLISPSDFLELASKFYPEDKKVDLTDENIEPVYEVKTAIAVALRNLAIPSAAFPAIEKFSKGDYLKLVSPALYSCCSRAPQNESLLFLETKLSGQPVSVQKNMIRLFFMISPLSGKAEILNELWKTEKNPSIRFEVFKQIYSLFNNLRSESTWASLKSSIESLTAEDEACLTVLQNSSVLDDSPEEFLSEFFQASLDAVVRTEVKDSAVNSIVTRITNVIQHVSDELLDKIVRDGVRNSQSKTYTKQFNTEFTSKYLLTVTFPEKSESLLRRLNIVKEIIKDLIENHWKDTKQSVNYFLDNVCREQFGSSTDMGHRRKEIFQGLLEEFNRYKCKTFRESLYLDLGLLQFDEVVSEGRSLSEKLTSFGKKVGSLLDSYVNQFGGELISWISEIIQDFLNSNDLLESQNDSSDENIVMLIEGILSSSHSRHHLIVAICFMPYEPPQNTNFLEVYEKVLGIFKNSDDLAVQVLWNKR